MPNLLRLLVDVEIYRHPDDRRLLEDEAGWAYDCYSLGLILLEIGLWTPISRLWKMKYNNNIFKSRIENVYVKKLGAKCGTAYVRIVQLLLSAPALHFSEEAMTDLAIKGFELFECPGQRSEDDRVQFSKTFLYTISKAIHRCCAIDIFQSPPASELDSLPEVIQIKSSTSFSAGYSASQPVTQDQGASIEMPTSPVINREPVSTTKESPGTLFPNLAAPIEQKSSLREPKKQCLKKWCNVQIPQEHLDAWNTCLMPKLGKQLQRVLKDSQETFSAGLMTIGETPETAKTTICVTCSSVSRVRAALKRCFRNELDGLGLVVVRGDIRRSKIPRKRKKPTTATTYSSPSPCDQNTLNPHYQARPLCGASIGAYKDGQHLPPVSYGGAVLVDGIPFGMTVHHMLDAPSDGEDDVGEGYFDEESEIMFPIGDWQDQRFMSSSTSLTDSDATEVPYTFEVTDDEDDDEYYEDDDDNEFSDSYSDEEEGEYGDEEDAISVGDTVGVDPEDQDDQYLVTQPALDDVHDDFFPNEEDRDEEHLASHSLGYVHASSGVRRWLRNGVKHEIDWALIKIEDERMHTHNLVSLHPDPLSSSSANPSPDLTKAKLKSRSRRQSSRNSEPRPQPSHLTAVTPMSGLAGLKVHCRGRTSGLQCGRISPAMTLVRMQGRRSFSSSFCVEGDFGVPGDSGAWVFDREQNALCGHVLAYSEKSRTAYISPMEVIFDDIKRTIGAEDVRLPGEIWPCADDGMSPGIVASQAASVAGSSQIQESIRGSERCQVSNISTAQRYKLGSSLETDLSRLRLDPGDQPNRSAAIAAGAPIGQSAAQKRQHYVSTTTSTITPPSSPPIDPIDATPPSTALRSATPVNMSRPRGTTAPSPALSAGSSSTTHHRSKDVPNSTKGVQMQMQMLGRRGVGIGSCVVERQVA